ncbi:MAG: M55 family metallopeptidase [Armatimonadetes bacterium]|nr:M55 family metallopeptidase [Armatimonadota bacterium]
MKVYISVDMEGIGGVVRPVQVQAGTPEYEVACRWMESEVCAYVLGAMEAGAKEVWVKDAHGSGANMRWDAFPHEVRFVSGRTRPTRFPGLDKSFSALFLVGYHAQAGTPDAVLDHTWRSADDTRFLINDVEVGEIAVDALIGGAFGVPVALVTGDDKTALEAKALLGKIESVITKIAVTREGAVCFPQSEVLARAQAGAIRALENARHGEFSPYRVELPFKFAMSYLDAESKRVVSSAEGVDVRTVLCEVLGQS